MTKRAPCRRCGNVVCSCLVDTLAGQMKQAGLPTPEREHRFMPGRRYAFDFAWPCAKIAIEVEGGIWGSGANQGAHTRGAHFISDANKYNGAAIMGWCVLRFATNHITSGEALDMIELALRSRGLLPVRTAVHSDAGVKYPAH